MAGIRNNKVGRLAAMAAADRVKLLLTLVEGDDFLSEVLESADRSMDGFRRAGMAADLRGDAIHDMQRACRGDVIANNPLGPRYHAAKRRSLDARRAAGLQGARTTGRA